MTKEENTKIAEIEKEAEDFTRILEGTTNIVEEQCEKLFDEVPAQMLCVASFGIIAAICRATKSQMCKRMGLVDVNIEPKEH